MASEAPVTKSTSINKGDLKKQGSQLKKVTTKEYSGEPTEEEIQAIKKIYDEKSSNPKALATHFELDADLLMDNLPENVVAFAKGLFQGLYTQDKDEAAKDRFRQRLQIELKRTSSKLRKSATKESTGPSAEDLAAAAKIFDEAKGDFAKIATALVGVQQTLLDHDPPASAAEFGQKLFAGNYTPDADEAAKQRLREVLRPSILQKRPSLKKTTTKEGAALGQEDSELQLAMKLYPGRNIKEIDAVAQNLGLSAVHMKGNPGEDAADFAKKLLSGAYTADQNEMVKADLRIKLQDAIKKRRPSLSKVMPRRMSNVSDEELTNFGNFYTKKGGNLDAIASESGLPIDALRAAPPANSADFVLKLFSGAYTMDISEQAKATLRACMRQEMMRTSKLLKRTATKEWDGEANEEDVKLIAAAFDKGKGDLKFLASSFSLNLSLVEAKPPANAQDFAKNVLLGSYTS